jgi:uncharacterized protein (TIGR00730 family)
MKTICVFSGSSIGADPVYAEAAKNLGRIFVDRGYALVYGGGSIGLMGILSRTICAGGGRVTGIIPAYINDRVAHEDISELVVTQTMHERKAEMYKRSDAFISLPGGIGTLEETAEIITWSGLGLHSKAVGILNIRGFYDNLIAFLRRAAGEGFFKQAHFDNLIVESVPEKLLGRLENYRHREENKWGPQNE